jgi:transitional endoplasmic reticulum ATPase
VDDEVRERYEEIEERFDHAESELETKEEVGKTFH